MSRCFTLSRCTICQTAYHWPHVLAKNPTPKEGVVAVSSTGSMARLLPAMNETPSLAGPCARSYDEWPPPLNSSGRLTLKLCHGQQNDLKPVVPMPYTPCGVAVVPWRIGASRWDEWGWSLLPTAHTHGWGPTHPRETDSSEAGRAHVHPCRPGRTTGACPWVPPSQTASSALVGVGLDLDRATWELGCRPAGRVSYCHPHPLLLLLWVVLGWCGPAGRGVRGHQRPHMGCPVPPRLGTARYLAGMGWDSIPMGWRCRSSRPLQLVLQPSLWLPDISIWSPRLPSPISLTW
jgi:hypothetical protein